MCSSDLAAVAGDTATMQERLTHLEKKHLDTVDTLFAAGARKDAAKKIVMEIAGEFRRICSGMELLGELPLRAMDAGLSVGERLSANLVALFLEQEGIPADAVDSAKCVVTDDNFSSARLLMEPTREATRDRDGVVERDAKCSAPRLVGDELRSVNSDTGQFGCAAARCPPTHDLGGDLGMELEAEGVRPAAEPLHRVGVVGRQQLAAAGQVQIGRAHV